MAEFSPMRTGQLVVRYHSPRRRGWVIGAVLLLALLMYGMYELGRYRGGYNQLAELQRRSELTERISTLEQENEKLRIIAADAQLARDVERKAYAEVEKTLEDLQAQVLRHREELAFYRGIVSPDDGIGGLRIQSFHVLPGGVEHHYRLRLVLVQSLRQDAVVSGGVSIQIEGVQDGAPKVLLLADAGVKTRADGQLPFQFRYFQNLEEDLQLPERFEPRSVTVEVRAGRAEPVRQSYPWQIEAEG